jgi:hypothetical protein
MLDCLYKSMCPHTAVCVCVLILVYMRVDADAARDVSSHWYICVLMQMLRENIKMTAALDPKFEYAPWVLVDNRFVCVCVRVCVCVCVR